MTGRADGLGEPVGPEISVILPILLGEIEQYGIPGVRAIVRHVKQFGFNSVCVPDLEWMRAAGLGAEGAESSAFPVVGRPNGS